MLWKENQVSWWQIHLIIDPINSFPMAPIKEFQLTPLRSNPYLEAYEHYKQTSENKIIKKTDDGNLHIKLTEYKQNGVDWLIITAIPDSQFIAEINKNIQTSITIIHYGPAFIDIHL